MTQLIGEPTRLFKTLLMAFVALGIATHAAAITIDFEDVSVGSYCGPGCFLTLNPLTTQGFVFSNVNGVNLSVSSEGSNQFLSGLGGSDYIVMRTMDGSPFDLVSFAYSTGSAAFVPTICAYGSAYACVAPVVSQWNTYYLGWSHLNFVTFGAVGNPSARIDNINVNVPEPGTLILFGGGLTGLIAARWRARRKVATRTIHLATEL